MPTLKDRRSASSSASGGSGGTSASPASARAKENAGNALMPAESPGPDASPAAAAAAAASATGKRKSRTAVSDLDRTADTQAGVEALLDIHDGGNSARAKHSGDSDAEEEKKDDDGGDGNDAEDEEEEEEEEEESARKKPRRVRGGAKSAKKKQQQKKRHRTASDLLDDSDDEEQYEDEEEEDVDDDEMEEADTKMDHEPASPEPKKRRASSKSSKSRTGKMPPITSPLSTHNRNDPGKPAEAGVIRRVYVENFMCHRRLTVDLCRNVNFIYGQNGSGKVRTSGFRFLSGIFFLFSVVIVPIRLEGWIRKEGPSPCLRFGIVHGYDVWDPYGMGKKASEGATVSSRVHHIVYLSPFYIILHIPIHRSTNGYIDSCFHHHHYPCTGSPPSWPPSKSASVPVPVVRTAPPTSRNWSARRPGPTATVPRSASPS